MGVDTVLPLIPKQVYKYWNEIRPTNQLKAFKSQLPSSHTMRKKTGKHLPKMMLALASLKNDAKGPCAILRSSVPGPSTPQINGRAEVYLTAVSKVGDKS